MLCEHKEAVRMRKHWKITGYDGAKTVFERSIPEGSKRFYSTLPLDISMMGRSWPRRFARIALDTVPILKFARTKADDTP
jgi:hypothetical protein